MCQKGSRYSRMYLEMLYNLSTSDGDVQSFFHNYSFWLKKKFSKGFHLLLKLWSVD